MPTRPSVLLAAAVGATVLACHEAPTEPVAVALQLDRDTYYAVATEATAPYGVRYRIRLIVQYQNRTGAPIYFGRCGASDSLPIYSIPTADGHEESGWTAAWACPYAPALEFPAGAVRSDTLLVEGPSAYDGTTHEPIGVLAGRFRLSYMTRTCADDACGCGQAGPRVASGSFEVRLR